MTTPLKENTDPIVGIYNYCDSWCERCLFTKRCQNFSQRYPDGLQQNEIDAETLVKRLMEALELTKTYLDTIKQKQRVPVEELVEREAIAAGLQSEQAGRHAVADFCDEYLNVTAAWLKDEADLLEQAGQQQAREVNLGIRTQGEALVLLNTLKDAWEVIKWYRTLIPVKVMSALQLFAMSAGRDFTLAAYFNGKAKLVLVSVDRSLSAWHTLLNHYPEKTDELLDMLLLLDRIRRQVENDFPDARTFRRPGLD